MMFKHSWWRKNLTEIIAGSVNLTMPLRLPSEVLKRVDQVVKARRVRVPRHTWLMEAVIEKLERKTS
jgi:predicted transcriptional regulator